MRKVLFLFISLFFVITAVKSEEPAITMTTTKAIGSTISIDLAANVINTIQIDFGDGVISNEIIGSPYRTITGNVGSSQTIKIYGAGIFVLGCDDMQISTLDVTKCSTLYYLSCCSNQLTTLDVTQNSALKYLYCWKNGLTSLDVNQNPALSEFQCYTNQFTFATLPIKQSTWTYYKCTPQNPIDLSRVIYTGNPLDLSYQYLINGNITSYTWRKKYGVALVQNTDYTITNGITIFLLPQEDSVCCQMTNTTFPDFTGGYSALQTTYIKVLPINNKQPQTITFDTLPEKKANDAAFTISASASSGLAVTFTSSDPSIASMSGNTVTIHKTGSVTITATQSGDSSWEAAPSVAQTLIINEIPETPVISRINENQENNIYLYPNPVHSLDFKINFHGLSIGNLDIIMINMQGKIVYSDRFVVSDNYFNLQLENLVQGVYIIRMLNNNQFIDQKLIVK